MAKGLKKKSDLELTTAERAAVLRAIAELDGKSSQKAVRKSAESILGAPEGSLDAKKAAIKEVCQEEMNRLEQQKPPKKQKRKKATLGAEGGGEADDDAPAEYVPKKPKVKPVSKDGQAERTGKFSKAESAEVMQAAEDEAKSRGVTVRDSERKMTLNVPGARRWRRCGRRGV
jgi:flagellar motor protein MotB